MKKTVKYLFLICSVYMSIAFAGLSQDSVQMMVEDVDRSGLVVLPVLYYTPETRIAGGLLLDFYFREGTSRPETKPSDIMPVFVYTQNNQIILELISDIYWKNESYFFHNYVGFIKFPDKFYGIGNNTDIDSEEDYTPKFFRAELDLQKRVIAALYTGIHFEFEDYQIIETQPDGQLKDGEIPGSEGGRISGLGLNVQWDSRDNLYFSKRGQYVKFSWYFFHPTIGSDFDYQYLILDLRTYHRIVRDHSMAFQGYLSSVTGSPPFHKLSLLGGVNLMRGFYSGRYRDKNMWIFQAEYRVPLFWRIGITGFIGIGDVFAAAEQLNYSDIKFSRGIGLRFSMIPKEKLNIRFDLGFGNNSSGFYITIGEAF